MRAIPARRFVPAGLVLALLLAASPVRADVESWKRFWPKTDFATHDVDYDEILSGGVPKDGIPPIDSPVFVSLEEAVAGIPGTEPVIGLVIDGDARAYPLRVLTWHEIVNDTVGGVPVAVTFCPLCNAAIVFDRELDGRVYDFGTTGKLRHSDLIMYDRQTESWWQQFTGTGIVGAMTGRRLKVRPARLESLAKFRARAPEGRVLAPNDTGMRPYGANPYARYDSEFHPFLYRGEHPPNIAALARVVTVGDRAWSLDLLRKRGRLETGDGLILSWSPGQNSALDARLIADGADVGNVTVQRHEAGRLVDVAYGVDFAFAFHAFHPGSAIVTE